MELTAFLQQNREVILRKWFDLIVSGYPHNASAFLAEQKDRFRNPVGHAISEALGPIYDQVVAGIDANVLSDALDPIVRIRSVQDFTASEAVAFVFEIKALIRTAWNDRVHLGAESAEMAQLDARIDRVALLAFDKYAECREQLHEVRANETRARWERMLTRTKGTAPGSRARSELDNDDSRS